MSSYRTKRCKRPAKGPANAAAASMPDQQSPPKQSFRERVTPTDPRYFDHRYFPVPAPGQSELTARIEQIDAIRDRLRQCHIRVSSASGAADLSLPTRNRCSAAARRDILAAILAGSDTPWNAFAKLLPARPYCRDDLAHGLAIRSVALAVRREQIQFNRPGSYDWLLFDIDRPDAYRRYEDAGLPAPTFCAVKPDNGHAHYGYLLMNPVLRFASSRRGPLEYLADIERGYVRRLGADTRYTGLTAKNPLHPRWRTLWLAQTPYTLEQLAGPLDRADIRKPAEIRDELGEGRSIRMFEELRREMYKEAIRLDYNPAAVRARCDALAVQLNGTLINPLSFGEVRAIAKSIAKWIVRNCSSETFSEIQRARAGKRWKSHHSADATKPWNLDGVSKATYFRRKKRSDGKAPDDSGTEP